MNLLFLTSTLPRYEDDAQAPFVYEQAQAWHHARPEDQISILAPHDDKAAREETKEGISIYRFIYWRPTGLQKLAYPAILPNIKKNPLLVIQIPFFIISQFFSTLRLIRKKKIDLIFAHWVMPQGIVAFLAFKLIHIPYVLKNYSSDVRVFHKIPFLGKYIARAIIQNSTTMFCENKLLRQEALAFLNGPQQSKMEKKIHALCMGVFSNLKSQSAFTAEKQMLNFGFIGRLTKKKGVEYLLKSIKRLKEEDPAISPILIIAGDGEEKKNLMPLANTVGAQFAGFISSVDSKVSFFNTTKVVVYPLINAKGDIEGLPVSLLEALYAGKLVIASKATNIEMLPEWDMIREHILLLHDPENINEFTELLKQSLERAKSFYPLKSDTLKEIFKRYHWNNLIYSYINPIIAGLNE
jgi:glycosyltransferase involved in cell wall biosynthesis